MRKILLLLVIVGAIILSVTEGRAQNVNRHCARQHAAAKTDTAAGISATDAELLISEIASAVGVSGEVNIAACDAVEKAQVWIAKNNDGVPMGEYIFFNPIWVNEVLGEKRTQAMFVFGHEFGHLIQRHLTSRPLKLKARELEADHFAGCAVGKLNGNWSEALDLIGRIRHGGIGGYPTIEESRIAAAEGYKRCTGLEPSDNSGNTAVFRYHGPKLSKTSLDYLESEFPSGITLEEDGYTKFQYETEILDLRAWIQFWFSGSDHSTTSIHFARTSETWNIYGKVRHMGESESEVKDLCDNKIDMIKEALAPLKLKDRPVATSLNRDHEVNFDDACNLTGSKKWECSRKYREYKHVFHYRSLGGVTFTRFASNRNLRQRGNRDKDIIDSVKLTCFLSVVFPNPGLISDN